MARFVPKGKMSKKAQKELNRQRRVTWGFSPVTKTVESKKRYNRKKNSCDRNEDYGIGVFQFSVLLSTVIPNRRGVAGLAFQADPQFSFYLSYMQKADTFKGQTIPCISARRFLQALP